MTALISSGCRHCDKPRHTHWGGVCEWTPPTQTQIKHRMIARRRARMGRLLNTCIADLRHSSQGCDVEDARELSDARQMRDDLRRGHHWKPVEILLTSQMVSQIAAHITSVRTRHAVLYLAYELEAALPSPDRVADDAQTIVDLAEQGHSETSRACHLGLWAEVLEMIRAGHPDPVGLADAAMWAYDSRSQRFVRDHQIRL